MSVLYYLILLNFLLHLIKCSFKQEEKKMYTCHVGNLQSGINEDQLKKIFSCAGEVKDARIRCLNSSRPFNFGFVSYSNLNEAEDACRMLNGKQVGIYSLLVSLSQETKSKIERTFTQPKDSKMKSSKSTCTDHSILHEPHIGGKSSSCTQKEKDLQSRFKDSLMKLSTDKKLAGYFELNKPEDGEFFIKNFKDILVNIAHVPSGVAGSHIHCSPDPVTKSGLENLIIRYYEHPVETKNRLLMTDIDLTSSSNQSLENTNFKNGLF